MITLPQRFWDKVTVQPGGCWLWNASVDGKGYGKFYLRGKYCTAHRLSYGAEYGAVPADGLDHLCRTKACVNPLHLEACSQAENVRRGLSGIEQRSRTHCPQGHGYTIDNLYVNPTTGKRGCRECRRVSSRLSKRRNRATPRADRPAQIAQQQRSKQASE